MNSPDVAQVRPDRGNQAGRSRTSLWNYPKVRDALVLALLAAVCFTAFGPAQNRFFAGDQFGFLAETQGNRTAWNVVRFWNYPSDRRYSSGDEALFRPLLFSVLGLEYSMFSYHWLAWNLTNLSAHIVVSFLLYKLLWLIRPGVIAVAVAIWFSVLNAHIELVLWSHLSGYLIAFAFFMVCLIAAWHILSGEVDARWLITFAVVGLIASLLYEMVAILVALTAGSIFLTRRMRGRPLSARGVLLCAAPTLIYGILYLVHIPFTHHLFSVDHARGFRPLTPGVFVAKVADSCLQWTRQVLVPWDFNYAIVPGFRFARRETGVYFSPPDILGIAATVAVLILFARGCRLARLKDNWPWLAMPVLGILAFAAMVCVGRGESDIAQITSYYPYLFSLLGIILVYSIVDFDRLRSRALSLAAGAIMLVAALNFAMTLQTCKYIELSETDWNRYFGAVSEFVDLHRNEPDFSFAIARPPREIDRPCIFVLGWAMAPHPSSIVMSTSEVVFAPYYRTQNPRYLLQPAR